MNNLLKDLLAMRSEHGLRDSQLPPTVDDDHVQIDEARGKRDLGELIEMWCDHHKAYSWEGTRGIRNFTELVGVMGYRGIDAFLEDNSGAIEAMVEWIGGQRNPEWRDAFAEGAPAEEDPDE